MARGTSILVLFILQILIAQSQDDCKRVAFPQEIAYKSDNFIHQDIDGCIPYTNDAAPTMPSVDPTQYVHCNQPTTITDSNTDPPTYIWGEASGKLLFIFSTEIIFENITIYYISNTTDQGRPKLRFHAVPDNFQVWDTPNSHQSEVFDEIIPGGEEVGVRKVPNSNDGIMTFNTSRVLIEKLVETKTYDFFISEVEFNRFCTPGGPTNNTGTATSQPTTTATGNTTDQSITTTVTATTRGIEPGGTSGQATSYGSYRLILATVALTVIKLLLC